MQNLKLRKEFLEKIISGEKVATSRFGVRMIHEGPLKFIATEDENIFVDVNVTEVVYLEFHLINDNDAVNEGYLSSNELKNTLKRIYPETQDDSIYTIITFERI